MKLLYDLFVFSDFIQDWVFFRKFLEPSKVRSELKNLELVGYKHAYEVLAVV